MRRSAVVEIILVAGIYFAAGKLGLMLAFGNKSASPVWPPTGISLAALLIGGLRLSPAIFIGAFLVNLTTTPLVGPSLAIALGNTLEAVAGAWLIRRFAGGVNALRRPRDVYRFVLCGAILSTMISATLGVSALCASGLERWGQFGSVWMTWWLGDNVSDLILAPMVISWWAWREKSGRRAGLETGMMFVIATLVAMAIFMDWPITNHEHYPVEFLCMPMLLWAAFRLSQLEAVGATFLVACIATWGTMRGHGPFAVAAVNESLLLLQAFMGCASVTVMVISASVAERGEAEGATLLQKSIVELLSEASTDGILMVDAGGKIMFFNQRFATLWGIPEDVLATRSDDTAIESVLDKLVDAAGFVERIRELQARPQESARDEIVLRDGRVFDRHTAPVGEAGGVCYGRVWFFRDVTQVRRAEAEREQLLAAEQKARQEAEKAGRAKDEFLAVLSHELRTPLTPVLASAAALQDDTRLPPEIRAELGTIRRNAELEARLIDDLLDLTRISRQKLELKPELVNVHEVLKEVVGMCAGEIDTAGHALDLELKAGHPWLRADRTRIHQVFWNLLKNAIKFTARGGRIQVRSGNDAQGRVVVEVVDDGMGIDREVLPKLFLAFEQGGRRVTSAYGGLGLGLAICRALVESHGGSISAESAGKGAGAIFRVVLPAASVAEVAAAGVEPASVTMDSPSMPGMRILLVEDHEDTRRVLTRLLASQGHLVKTAMTMTGALELVEREKFDLLVSDLGLPDGSGLDLMRMVRDRGQIVQGVAVSGYGMEDDIRRSREAGFAEHLVKPIDYRRLEAAIRQLAGRGLEPAVEG